MCAWRPFPGLGPRERAQRPVAMVALKDLAAGSPTRPASPALAFARDFLAHVGPDRSRAAFLIGAGAVLEGVGLILLLPLLAVVLGTDGGTGWIERFSRSIVALAPAASPAGRLGFLLLLFALLMALRSWVILSRDVLLARLQIGFVEAHRLRIIEGLAHSRWDVVARLRHGRITHVLGGDIQACGDAAQLVLQLGVAGTMLVMQCLLLFLLSPPLALLILGLLGLGALALRPVLGRAQAIGHGLTEANLHLVTGTSQFLGGLKLAISQSLQGAFVREFEETIVRARERRIAFVRQRTGAQLVLTALAAAVGAATLLLGIGLLGTAPATLIGFLFILVRMTGPAAQIQAGAQHVFHSLPAYGKIKVLETELGAGSDDPAGTAQAGRLQGGIEFGQVTYRHSEERAAGIENVSLTIEPGSFIGIGGPSGAGKTTFADLLIGLYPPQTGSIRVAGQLLDGSTLAEWRRSIGYVAQDPFLFHDTIRRNLAWANPDAGEDELWEALALAGAHDLVRGLESGLDTVAGERGSLLSGGERQRIGLARALLRRPSLLLLDEATNAIDIEAERRIVERLARMTPRPTIVMIAHRPSSLELCERLIEIRNGRILRDD
jgi:ATP-binding cassette subfamily C protein